MLLALVLACVPGKVLFEETGSESRIPDDSRPPVDTGPQEMNVALVGPQVFDPILGGPVALVVSGAEEALVRAELRDETGFLVRTLADGSGPATGLSWDGTDETGALAAVGRYTVTVTATRQGYLDATASQDLALVRLGLSSGTLGGDERVPLIWHRDGGGGRYYVHEAEDATFTLSALTDEAGDPVAIPSPWEDLDSPPEDLADQNMPAAFPYDARPVLALAFGGEVGDASVTARVEGWETVNGAVADGGELVFQRADALSTGPGVVEETLTVTYESGGQVVATQDVPIRVYALLGPPTFDDSGSPYYPWVAVIDPALRDMVDVPPTDEDVIGALVDYIFSDLGLSYDTRYGASAYMSYGGWGWDSARFNMTSFLSRSNGSVVNCSDCAGILSAHANMLGAYLGQSIISPNFDLNYILAIGGDEFTHCPFGSGRCGFNYHAVTSPDESDTIYDATLALDGDEDPSAEPNELLMVQAISGDEYLERLVMDGSPDYSSYGTGEIQ